VRICQTARANAIESLMYRVWQFGASLTAGKMTKTLMASHVISPGQRWNMIVRSSIEPTNPVSRTSPQMQVGNGVSEHHAAAYRAGES
jgi:hypothetical protein